MTRDRVSAYAKVIEQELPGTMQITDQFHIHQNLLDAIKKALYKELPSSIKVEDKKCISAEYCTNSLSKKNP